jgi:hypothetical protein
MSKRRSLAEIVQEDEQTTELNPIPMRHIAPVAATAPERKSEIRNAKSDFVKLSVTVPPEMFEMLENKSRERRRSRTPHTMSALVREALGEWLSAS